TVEGGMEGIHLVAAAEGVRIAQGNRLRTLFLSGIRPGGQCVLSIEQRYGGVVVNVVPAVEGMVIVYNPIDAADPLVVGVVGQLSEQLLTAGIRRNRQVCGNQLEAGLVERRRWDLVVRVRSAGRIFQYFGGGQASAVRLGAVQNAEVAFKGRGGRNVSGVLRRVASLTGPLIAAKEE